MSRPKQRLSSDEIEQQFGTMTDFKALVMDYREGDFGNPLYNFLVYLIAHFRMCKSKDEAAVFIAQIVRLAKTQTDAVIYLTLRNQYDVAGMCPNNGKTAQDQNYKMVAPMTIATLANKKDPHVRRPSADRSVARSRNQKINELEMAIKAISPQFAPKKGGRYGILDIGNESSVFLDSLELLELPVRGINIDNGFCHYDPLYAARTDPRFQIYDGRNIPAATSSVAIVTLFSVVHHVPDDAMFVLALEMHRVLRKNGRGFLFIKDVDLITPANERLFRIQHYLFEGVLCKGSLSYMNTTVTAAKTIRTLQRAGFKGPIYMHELTNFNRSYYVLMST